MLNRTRNKTIVCLCTLLIALIFIGTSIGQDRADYTSALHYEDKYEDDRSSFNDFKMRGSIGYLISDSGLRVFDFTDNFEPQNLSNVWGLNGDFVDLAGEFAYVSANDGIFVVNIADPTNTQLLGHTDIENPGCPLVVCGDYVYSSSMTGLAKIDVTDPAAPYETNSLVFAGGGFYPIAADGNLLIASSLEEIVIIDVTNPEASVVLGTFDYNQMGTNPNMRMKLVVEDNLVFVVNNGHWEAEELVRILDISNPAEIVTVGRWNYPGTVLLNSLYAANVAYSNGSLYYLSHQSGTYVIDVSNPASPVTTQHLRDEYNFSHNRRSVHISGDMLYSLISGVIHYVGIETHSVIGPLGVFDTGQYIYCLDDAPLLNNKCLVGSGLSFQIVDHSQPSNPTLAGSLDIAARDIHTVENVAYLAANDDGLFAVDISDGANPTIINTLEISAENVTALGQYLYIKGDNKLSVVDISNPAQLTIIGQCPYELSPELVIASSTIAPKKIFTPTTHTGDIAISNSTVLLTKSYHNYYEDALWFNVEDPTNPYLFHTQYADGPDSWVCGLDFDYQDNMVISTSEGYRAARDVSDPYNPVNYSLAEPGGNFARSGDLLYMIHNSGGWGFPTLRLIDASDPTRLPVIGAAYIEETAMSPYDLTEGSVVVSGDHVAASWGNELYFMPRHGDGVVPVFLSGFNVSANLGSVNITWATQGAGDDGEFKLTGRPVSAVTSASWDVPYSPGFGGSYAAHDTQTELAAGGNFEYSLFHKENSGQWAMLESRTIELEMPGLASYLSEIHPNPFNPLTNISFYVGQKQQVSVDVFDLAGRRLAVLSDQIYNVGQHTVSWDGKDVGGRDVSSGTYMVRMKTDSSLDTKKITLVR